MENAPSDIRKLVNELNERQKELNCLYKINDILKNDDVPIEEILLKIVETLPLGFQFPDICKAQIIFNGKAFQSKGFQITELKQTAKIKFEGTEVGEIQVFYIKPVKSETRRIFLIEEQLLINSIAEDISQYVSMQQYREFLHSGKEVSERLHIPAELSNWLSGLKLQENEIKEILSTSVVFKKGELIFKQGTLVSYMVILTSGLAKVHIEDLKGRSYIYKLVKPFELVGLSSMFGKGNYGFTATAILNSSGYLVRRETIRETIEKNIKFNYEILNRYSENLSLAYHKMNFLANKQALGRLADTLLYLWKDIFDEKTIENSITRKIIAELSGMSTENAVRIMSEFKNDGVITISKEGIQIIKPELLETYSLAG
ncbi:MAG: Crp/Fnr family transcriptional regulator [Bacteroidales bacterium]|nr:Crp/Fnr family transcriptional regulator [Bacteroidales bacterium]